MEKIIVALFVLMAIVKIAECDVSSTALVPTTAIKCGPELLCHWSKFGKCLLYFTKCVVNEVYQVGKLLSVSNCLYDLAGDLIIDFIHEGKDIRHFEYPRIAENVLRCMGLPAHVDISNNIYNALKEFKRKFMDKR